MITRAQMNATRMHVHNLNETKALIKEMNARGEIYDRLQFYSHEGQFLAATKYNSQTYKMELINFSDKGNNNGQ